MDNKYCYPGTDILKNKLGIKDKDHLTNAETRLAYHRLVQLQAAPLSGSFDFKHLLNIHRHIFQDLYDWAGKVRTVNIAKGSMFCLVQHIDAYAATIFPAYYNDCMAAKGSPEVFVKALAAHYADLNALHPFREGNGRAQREFARELCLKCGYTFDLTKTNHKEMLSASVQSMDRGDNKGLENIFTKLIAPLDDH